VIAELTAALHSPRYAESALAVQAMSRRMTFEQALEFFRSEAKRNPAGGAARAALGTFYS